jgi:hypothetical protein
VSAESRVADASFDETKRVIISNDARRAGGLDANGENENGGDRENHDCRDERGALHGDRS